MSASSGSDLSHRCDLSDILRGHFYEITETTKNKETETKQKDRLAVKDQWTGGARLTFEKNKSLKKILLLWSWNLLYRNVLFFYKPKARRHSDICNTFNEIFNLASVLLKIGYFEIWQSLWRQCDIIRWMFVHGKKRSIAILLSDIGSLGFKITGMGAYRVVN